MKHILPILALAIFAFAAPATLIAVDPPPPSINTVVRNEGQAIVNQVAATLAPFGILASGTVQVTVTSPDSAVVTLRVTGRKGRAVASSIYTYQAPTTEDDGIAAAIAADLLGKLGSAG